MASILEIGIDDIPEIEDFEDAAFEAMLQWVKEQNIRLTLLVNPKEHPMGYSIAVGKSPRFDGVQHAIVAKDGIPVFDPHPDHDGTYIDGTITEWWILESA